MSQMELPLVFFTVLAQASIGLILLSVLSGRVSVEGSSSRILTEPVAALVFLSVALLASLGHLGHPFGAFRTLTGLTESWLSREILAFLVLSCLLVVAAGLSVRDKFNAKLWKLTAVVGLVALIAQGMAYAPPSQPALGPGVVLVLFLMTALALGTAFGSWFAPDQRQPLLAGILAAALVVGLILSLLLPSVWLSGGLVAEATGSAYLVSPLYWGRILVGFLIPLLVLLRYRSIPPWLVWFVLVGEFGGRIVLFSLTASSAAFIGLPL
jgi:DMSO reductase anchor subunit